MAKLNREARLREKRVEKHARKAARRLSATEMASPAGAEAKSAAAADSEREDHGI